MKLFTQETKRVKMAHSAVLEKVIYNLWIQGLVRNWRRNGKNIEIEFTKSGRSIKKVSINLNCEGIRALNRPGLLRAFVSTDQGIITKDECVQRSIGGRVLFLITA